MTILTFILYKTKLNLWRSNEFVIVKKMHGNLYVLRNLSNHKRKLTIFVNSENYMPNSVELTGIILISNIGTEFTYSIKLIPNIVILP